MWVVPSFEPLKLPVVSPHPACRSGFTTYGDGGASTLSWTGRSVVTSGTRYLTNRSPEGAMVIETVVNGRPTVSALMNPNGNPAIAQGCRVGEVTLVHTPPGDSNRNAVAAVEGIDPRTGMGNERVGHNRLAVGGCGDGLPRVGPRSSAQPWAGGRNAVGVGDRRLVSDHDEGRWRQYRIIDTGGSKSLCRLQSSTCGDGMSGPSWGLLREIGMDAEADY
jgi:hypothetical protein